MTKGKGQAVGLLTLALLMVGGTARAGGPRTDAIPYGDGWFCYRGDIEDHSISFCSRSKHVCESNREVAGNKLSNVETECSPQAKAAVYTYYDVMHDEWEMWAAESTSDCKFMREMQANNEDTRNLSSCGPIGKIIGKPLKPKAIPEGDGWWCVPWEIDDSQHVQSGTCSRTREDCETDRNTVLNDKSYRNVGDCGSHESAFVATVDKLYFVYPALINCLDMAANKPHASICTEMR